MKKPQDLIITLFCVSILGCASGKKAHTTAFELPGAEVIPNSINATDLKMGGFSGLALQPNMTSSFDVFIITDRGPNGKAVDHNKNGVDERPFVVPDYHPQILNYTYNPQTQDLKFKKSILLKTPQGKPLTGLPNERFVKGKKVFDEEPVDYQNNQLNYDSFGIDPESIVTIGQKGFWIGEEYGPSLLKVNRDGMVQKRLVPKIKNNRRGSRVLPKVLARRQLNGGFEALALSGHHLYAFLQKPLTGSGSFAAVLKLDTRTDQVVGFYAYPMQSPSYRIGGATALLNGKIVVIEQNGELFHQADQKLYEVDFSKAKNFIKDPMVNQMDKPLLISQGMATKTPMVDLSAQGLFKYEKIEGVATLDGENIYLVNDNDFNLKSIMEDSSEREPNLFFHIQVKKP